MATIGGANVTNRINFVENKAQKKQIFNTLRKYKEEVGKIKRQMSSIQNIKINITGLKQAIKDSEKIRQNLEKSGMGVGRPPQSNIPRPPREPVSDSARMSQRIKEFDLRTLSKLNQEERQRYLTQLRQADTSEKLRLEMLKIKNTISAQNKESARLNSILKFEATTLSTIEGSRRRSYVLQLKQIKNAQQLSLEMARIRKKLSQEEQIRRRLVNETNQQNLAQKRLNGSMDQMVGTVFSVFTGVQAIAAISRTGMEFQAVESTMLAVSENAQQAKQNLEFVRKEARRLGADLTQTSKSFAQLLANQGSLTLDQIKELTSSVLEASVVLGQSSEDTTGSIRALVQMLGKGQVMSEELKGQLAERMPVALKVFAKAAKEAGLTTKGTTQELFELMEVGGVAADKILPHVAKGFKDFANTNNALNKSLGRFSVILGQSKFDLQNFQKTLFDRGVQDGLKFLLQGFTDLMRAVEPLSNLIGGAFRGAVIGIALPFRVLWGVIHDLTVYLMGDMKQATKDTINNFLNNGAAVLGFVGGIIGLIKALKKLRGAMKAVKGVGSVLNEATTSGGTGRGSLLGKVSKKPIPVYVVNKSGMETDLDLSKDSNKSGRDKPKMNKAGKLFGKVLGGTILFPIFDAIAEMAIGDTEFGKWAKRTTLGDLFPSVPTPTNVNTMYGQHLATNGQPAYMSQYPYAGNTTRMSMEPQKVEVDITMNDNASQMMEVRARQVQSRNSQSIYDN